MQDTPLQGTVVITPAIIFGALLPDLSLFVMWGVAKLNDIPERVIWSEWYYTAFWQSAGSISNSFPVYGALALGSWWLLYKASETVEEVRSAVTRSALVALCFLALAALTHVATDLPLHHDDGHAHFWPFSDWIFSSPVSYWDPRHYGGVWSVIELLLALVLVVVLCRRYQQKWVRVVLCLLLLTYFAVAGYWFFVFVSPA